MEIISRVRGCPLRRDRAAALSRPPAPYNPVDGIVVEGFNFVEEVDGSDHDKYLWCNAAFALGARLTSAFEQYGWCAAIRGVEGAAWSKICRPTLSHR